MQVVFGENLIPLTVDAVSLCVQDVVIFQQVLADVKVRALHTGLGLFHQFVDQRDLDRHILVDLKALQQALHLLPAEQAHEVVIQSEVKSRGTRVALASGAPAQLIIDAAGFVALGADHVQAAQLAHFRHVIHIDEEGVNSLLLALVQFSI